METTRQLEQMNISGIVVCANRPHLDELASSLRELPGIDIHHADPDTGKIIITQDLATEKDQVDGLRRIQRLPHVLYAELVYHYVGDGE